MADWIITTAIGTGEKGFAGDGGKASEALLNGPFDIAFDRAGNLYFSDTFNHRIRRVEAATGHHLDHRRNRRSRLFRRRRPGDSRGAQRALRRRRRPRRQCLYRRPAQPQGAPHRRRLRHHHDARRNRRGGLFGRRRAGVAGGPRRAERARLRSRRNAPLYRRCRRPPGAGRRSGERASSTPSPAPAWPNTAAMAARRARRASSAPARSRWRRTARSISSNARAAACAPSIPRPA